MMKIKFMNKKTETIFFKKVGKLGKGIYSLILKTQLSYS